MIKTFSLLIAILFSSTSFALSEGTYQVIIKKQQEKQNTRWSLADWMGTKKKIALMDQWLAINSSSSYMEFAVYGSKNDTDFTSNSSTPDKSESGNEFGALMYYRIFGLETKFEEIALIINDKNLLFGLRLFGKSDQGSHIKILYGLNSMKDYQLGERASQRVFGASASFYLLPFLGIDGGYRKYADGAFKASGAVMNGESVEYGAFIELYLLRLYIKQQEKNLYYKDVQSASKKTFKTTSLGLKIYF